VKAHTSVAGSTNRSPASRIESFLARLQLLGAHLKE
jgi:hypothetical protein